MAYVSALEINEYTFLSKYQNISHPERITSMEIKHKMHQNQSGNPLHQHKSTKKNAYAGTKRRRTVVS